MIMKKGITLLLIFTFILATHGNAATVFSPNNDGIKDTAVFKLKLSTPQDQINTWTFEIKNVKGKTIRIFKGKGALPEKLEWDGRDENKFLVKDTEYSYVLTIITKAGNKQELAPQAILIDHTKPTATATADIAEFSPNADGIKDEITFTLAATDASGINSWLLAIDDEKEMNMKSFSGLNDVKPVIVWDGKGNFGEDALDGTYTYTLTVQDNAGNRFKTEPQKIRLIREAKVSTITVQPRVFSPNNDGTLDSLEIMITVADIHSVDRWALKVLNSIGKIVKTYEGRGVPPLKLVWDGVDDKNKTVNDGTYNFILSETDKAGNTVSTVPVIADLDTTPPTVRLSLDNKIFSPNGDKLFEKAKFSFKISDNHQQEWKLFILNDIGKPVKVFEGKGKDQEKELEWNGKNDSGREINDGIYTFHAEAKDIAENKVKTEKLTVQIDRTPPKIEASASPLLFSPNNDGVMDETDFQINVLDASPIENWALEIKSPSKKVIRTYKGTGSIDEKLTWNGKSDDRSTLPDGTYTWTLYAKDIVGNKVKSEPQEVVIGATKPTVDVKSDFDVFSPNADGYRDSIKFTLSVKAFNTVKDWKLKILIGKDQVVRTFRGSGVPPETVTWQGENDKKKVLGDGRYHYVLTVNDEAGNNVSSIPKLVVIDTAKPTLSTKVDPSIFSPNGDSFKDTVTFIIDYKDESVADSWLLEIENSKQKLCKKFEGTGNPPLSQIWDGRDENQVVLEDGIYKYLLTVKDIIGNETTTSKEPVKIDNSPPEASLKVKPTLFSPNDDGEKDTATFTLEYKDASDISDWKLQARGPEPAIRTFSGTGRPSHSIIWNGKNERDNNLPDGMYTATLIIKDEVGNEGKSESVQVKLDTAKPVVAVITEDEPIQTLAPTHFFNETKRGVVISLAAELLFDTGKANLKDAAKITLNKALNVIKRYPDRRINIEGHTDNVPINTQEFPSNQVLSEKRAESVKNYFVSKAKINEERFSLKGFGDSQPMASNKTEEGRKRNRRVEIILLK